MQRRSVLGAAALALPLLPVHSAGAAPAAPGQPVAWPALRLLDGTELAPAHWNGRAAVVVFWSTTCPFCRRHNQHVQALYRAAAGQPLTVLAVARDRDVAAVQRYVQQQGYRFPVTMDYAPMAAALSRRNMIPLTVTVDLQGRLKQVFPGEMFEEDLLEMLQLARPTAKG